MHGGAWTCMGRQHTCCPVVKPAKDRHDAHAGRMQYCATACANCRWGCPCSACLPRPSLVSQHCADHVHTSRQCMPGLCCTKQASSQVDLKLCAAPEPGLGSGFVCTQCSCGVSCCAPCLGLVVGLELVFCSYLQYT